MQVRVANRQDEPAIRAIVNQTRAQHGEPEIDPAGSDSDLNNVEQHYFWNDGVFLVAEDEGEIIGLIGARRGDSEETLELLRLAVSPTAKGTAAVQALLDTVLFFAGNLNYRQVVTEPARLYLDAGKPIPPFRSETADRWSAPV